MYFRIVQENITRHELIRKKNLITKFIGLIKLNGQLSLKNGLIIYIFSIFSKDGKDSINF